MRSDASSRNDPSLLVFWPVVFGLVLTALRLFVLVSAGASGAAGTVTLLAGLPGQIAFGLFLALPLHLFRASGWRVLAHAVTALVVFLNTAAFHYESVFGRLPGASMLYYLREARHLAGSVGANASPAALAAEVIIATAVLIATAEWLARHAIGRTVPLAAATVIGSAVLTVLFVANPSLLPGRALWSSRVPIFWAIQTWSFGRAQETAGGELTEAEILRYQTALGHRVPFGGADPRYPLCGRPAPDRQGNGRSVIFLVLESVGTEELRLVHDGRPVMPNLQRIAGAGLFLPRVKASGTKSLQAMPALFAGIPPQSAQHFLWRKPLPNIEGFPRLLRQRGYRTAYFHGGDLSFEQQRPFLRMAGFEELHEYTLFEGHPFLAWGHSDDVMFGKLRAWIEAARRKRNERPFLATLFTLSTHDPFVIPPGRDRVFAGEGARIRFLESLRFADEQLGAFYDWYLAHEAPRGTLLVITGDHAPHLAGDRRLQDGEVNRFDMPLIVHGVPRERLASVTAVETRPAAQYDLPATILGLAGLSPGRCDQGLDLFAPDAGWSRGRVLYAVAGDQLETFHAWLDDRHVRLDLIARTATVTPPGPGDAGYERRARDFYELAHDVSATLNETNGFAPPPAGAQARRPPLPRSTQPLFVAHRGQSRGPGTKEIWNRRATIEQALADGFEWIEIDVNLTRDDIPVLLHDPAIDTPAGRRPVRSMTLAAIRAVPGFADVLTLEEALSLFAGRAGLLIEVKPQGRSLYDNTIVALRAAALVRSKRASRTIIMDSYSPLIAASLEQHCECPVGLDAPPRELDSRWVDEAAASGMEWIYVDHRQASPELIRYAHGRGLRVLVFTVNDVRQIARLKDELPDAIITDRAALRAEVPGGATTP